MPASTFKEAEQTEKAYQKQDAVFIGRKRTLAKKSKKGMRYVRNVGLGFKTPKLALEGSCGRRAANTPLGTPAGAARVLRAAGGGAAAAGCGPKSVSNIEAIASHSRMYL